MSTPMVGPVRLFTRCEPRWPLGHNTLTVRQHLAETQPNPAPGLAEPVETATLLETVGGPIHFEVVGSATELPPGEVLACFPPPGVEDASPFMLPSVLLRRRTLPWERPLAGAPAGTPWLALLTLLDAEPGQAPAEYTRTLGPVPRRPLDVPAGTHCDQISVESFRLLEILPRRTELALLCHTREVSRDDRETRADDDGFVAVVVGNRLPTPGRKHTTFLVSLEGLYTDNTLWPPDEAGIASAGGVVGGVAPRTALVVLHAWSFTAASAGGADFEALMHGVQAHVARFGTRADGSLHPATPLSWRAGDGALEGVLYRGPLQPFPTQDAEIAPSAEAGWWVGPDGTLDPSRAAAFELGRLLATASPELLTRNERARHDGRERPATQRLQPPWLPAAATEVRVPVSDGPGFGFPVPVEVLAGLQDRVRARFSGPETDPVRLGAQRPLGADAPAEGVAVAARVLAGDIHKGGLAGQLDRQLAPLVAAVAQVKRS